MTNSDTSLGRATVGDAMNTGILMTDPQTPLRVVAGLMADRKVHAVAVADEGYARRPLSIVSMLDVAAAVVSGSDPTAAQAARTAVITVRPEATIEEAARLMVENQIEHLVVVNSSTGHAEGVLSALDVAAAFGSAPD